MLLFYKTIELPRHQIYKSCCRYKSFYFGVCKFVYCFKLHSYTKDFVFQSQLPYCLQLTFCDWPSSKNYSVTCVTSVTGHTSTTQFTNAYIEHQMSAWICTLSSICFLGLEGHYLDNAFLGEHYLDNVLLEGCI